MMEPPPLSSIAGIWCLAPRNALVRLVASASFQPASEMPELVQGHGLAQRSRVVEGDVEPAERAGGQFDQRHREGLRAHVASERDGLAVGRDDLGDQAIEFVLPARGHHHLRALFGEQLRRRPPDS